MPADGFTIHFGDNSVHFDGPVELLTPLEAHFQHCHGGADFITAHYTIIPLGKSRFNISLDGGDLYSNLGSKQVLFHLMQDAIPRLNGAAHLGPVIHAAALTQGEHGLILCGESGSGKSTLTAWLAAQCFGYLTDEVICLEGEQIGGLPRSIVLKRGSAFVWQKWLGNPPAEGFLQFTDGTTWIDPILFGADVCPRATPHALIFPRYLPNKALYAEPLKPADALFRLMKGLVNARNFPDGGLAAASRLAKQVRAWQLTYSDLESATAWIRQTLAD